MNVIARFKIFGTNLNVQEGGFIHWNDLASALKDADYKALTTSMQSQATGESGPFVWQLSIWLNRHFGPNQWQQPLI